MAYYIALTNDFKVNDSSSMNGFQAGPGGTFYVTDYFYQRWAEILGTTVEKLKAYDDANFISAVMGNPLGCYALSSLMGIALVNADPRPYNYTVGGIKLFVAEPAGGVVKTQKSGTPPFEIIFCTGIRIIAEVPLQDYIAILHGNWPDYY
jgi:hypothetical protein